MRVGLSVKCARTAVLATGLEEEQSGLVGNRRRGSGPFDESAGRWMGQVRSPGGQSPKADGGPFIQEDASQGMIAALVLGGGTLDEPGKTTRSRARSPRSSSTTMNT